MRRHRQAVPLTVQPILVPAAAMLATAETVVPQAETVEAATAEAAWVEAATVEAAWVEQAESMPRVTVRP
jgi:hypothetical protein